MRIHKVEKRFDTSTALGRVKESYRVLIEKHFYASHDNTQKVFCDMASVIKQSPHTLTEAEYIDFRLYVSRVNRAIVDKSTWIF